MPTKFPRKTAVIAMAALPAVLALNACGSSSPMDQYAGTYTGSSGRTTRSSPFTGRIMTIIR